MKLCAYCGKEYLDEASVCAVDGHPLRDVVPPLPAMPAPPVPDKQQIVDDEHIKLLAIFHFVIAGLALLGIFFLCLHYLVLSTFLTNPDLWKDQKGGPPPKALFDMFIWLYVFLGSILGIVCFFNALSGMFLRQKKHRTFSLVIGALNCLQIPFGTVLGVFTIIVLSRDSVRARYND